MKKDKEHCRCKIVYINKKYADKCEVWRSQNKSCNLKIVKHYLNSLCNQFHQSKYKPCFFV